VVAQDGLAVAVGNAEEDLQVLGRAAGGEDLFGRFQPAQPDGMTSATLATGRTPPAWLQGW
jgi:hypothetical protein